MNKFKIYSYDWKLNLADSIWKYIEGDNLNWQSTKLEEQIFEEQKNIFWRAISQC